MDLAKKREQKGWALSSFASFSLEGSAAQVTGRASGCVGPVWREDKGQGAHGCCCSKVWRMQGAMGVHSQLEPTVLCRAVLVWLLGCYQVWRFSAWARTHDFSVT